MLDSQCCIYLKAELFAVTWTGTLGVIAQVSLSRAQGLLLSNAVGSPRAGAQSMRCLYLFQLDAQEYQEKAQQQDVCGENPYYGQRSHNWLEDEHRGEQNR